MQQHRDSASLRSHRWLGVDDLRSFGHRSRMAQMGFGHEEYDGKPVIGIINTWSEINGCHIHLRQRAEDVKRGVFQAGGFPIELPAMSLAEVFVKPTTMLYRNFLAMEVEELLRSHPIDAAVLMGGCDKTTPALVMGATSVDIPAIFVPAGPMLTGHWRGRKLASGTDTWRYWAERQAGNLSDCAWREIESGIARSPGHCMTMGTASTMAAAVETLGLTVNGAASIPAPDSRHAQMASRAGRIAVEMAWSDRRISTILSARAFLDAIVAVLALGGSTNAVVHLIAMARRAGVALDLDDFDRLSRSVPVLADIQPAGAHLMEEFHLAGGVPGLLSRVVDQLHLDRITVTGETLADRVATAEVIDDEVIRPLDNPLSAEGGLAVLRGSLAPDGAVIKHVAASPELLTHTGPAVVFDSYDEMSARLATDESIDRDAVLVLRNAGPVGGPGMPEWGMLPLPAHLLRAGVRDMVRISDARMSGTSYGTCVLHVAPESHVGGPLGLVENGDLITLDVEARRLDLMVDDDELARRRERWRQPPPHYVRGYGRLAAEHMGQANTGCDFDFLEAGGDTPEPSIH